MSTESHEPVDALLAEYLEARRSGKRAESDALLHAHPELAADVALFIDDYEQLDRRFAPLRSLVDSAPCSAAEMPTFVSGDTAVAQPLQVGGSFGDYDLLAEIARGGMGVVYKVRQRSLNRVVALKMVLGGSRSSASDRDRFLVEARAVARLNHPHIVPIYEVGEHAGQPYFTMEFFAGGGLNSRLEELRGDQRAIAQLMITVARAVEHAHRRGILHRDLKPSNVLLDERRQPHVTDFGLAKRLDEESDLTQAGAIVGTPSYMAPEQAKSQTDLTTAVDVYGLGAVLYELLTGRPPFKAGTPLETLQKLVSQEPQPPRTLAATVDPDLETICLKCLEKDPLARYGSADALADDLERWLTGQPIQARPVTTTERVVKWARRQPLLAGLLGTVAAAVIALLALGGFLWQNAELRAQAVQDLGQAQVQLAQVDTERKQAEKERGQAEKEREQAKQLAAEQRKLADEQSKLAKKQKDLADKFSATVEQLQKTAEAEAAKADAARKQADAAQEQTAAAQQQLDAAQHEARRTIYAADMQLASAAWQSDNISLVTELVERYRNIKGQEDLRGFEWNYFARRLSAARLSWSLGSSVTLGLAVSPDAKTLATVGLGGKVKTWNLADGKLLRTIDAGKAHLTSVFFADEGRKLTAVARKNAFDFSAIGRTIEPAVAKKEKFTLGYLTSSLEFHTWNLTDQGPPVVEPFDATRLGAAIFPVIGGGCVVQHEGEAMVALTITRSRDGNFLALGGTAVALNPAATPNSTGMFRGGRVLVWDLMKSEVHAVRKTVGTVTAAAFAADGQTLAVAYSDGAIELFESDIAKEPRRMVAHRGYVYSLEFSADGSRLASGAADGTALLWDIAAGTVATRFVGHTTAVFRIALTPDAQTLVSGSVDGTVKVWNVHHTGEPLVLRGHEQATVGTLAFSSDGSELISADTKGAVKAWRAADGALLRDAAPAGEVGIYALSNDGKMMVRKDAKVKDAFIVRDLVTGTDCSISWKDCSPFMMALSGDNKLVVASTLLDGQIAVWNIADSKPLATLDKSQGFAIVKSFSPDGKTIAASQERALLLWNWETGQSRKLFEDKSTIPTAVAFSSDGSLLAAALDNVVRIWDLSADRLRAECHGAGQRVGSLAFSPDGRRLATGIVTTSQQGLVKMWDTTSGREVFMAPLPTGQLTAMALSPDGRRLAAAVTGADVFATMSGQHVPIEIYLWDATPVAAEAPAKDDAAQLQGTWIVTSAKLNGAIAKSSEGDKFTFDGDKVTIENKVKKTAPVIFRLDSAKQPKEIDIEEQPAMRGIYELNDNELRLCYSVTRPAKFDSKQWLLLTLKRESP